MVDYVRDIGGGAEMMIRDLGISNGHIEFWFHAGSQTWNNQQDWGYNIGGGYVGGVFKLNTGGAWHHLGTVHVPTTRNVLFRIVDEGLAFPGYDFNQTITRAKIPPAPTMRSAIAVSTTQVDVYFTGNGDGGTPIREWQIGYSTSANGPNSFVASDGTTRISGLTSGVTYHFWARGRNDLGWGPWSARASDFTWRIPDAPTPVTFIRNLITQTSVRILVTGTFDGGEPIDQWQLAYGLSPNVLDAAFVGPSDTYTAQNARFDLLNLVPGATYYFWSRGRNAVGWSPWSSVRTQTLRAGAMVKDGGIWKRALPYQKVNGVWRLVKPYVKQAGVWRETS